MSGWDVVLAMMVVAQAAAADPAAEPKAATNGKTFNYAHLELKGEYAEGTETAGLFGELVETLPGLFSRLEKAAADDSIQGIVLQLREPSLGWGQMYELRGAILKAKAKGKPIIAWMESAHLRDYMIAATCDQILAPEGAMFLMPGLRSEITFYKNLLDKLSIQTDVLAAGEFKSAGEPYSRTEMSAPFRQEMESMMDDYYRQIVEIIGTGRKLTPAQVTAAIDGGLHTAKSAKELGLIDQIAYETDLPTIIRNRHNAPEATVKLQRNYGKKKIDTDFSGFGGLAKLMNLLMGVEPGSGKSRGQKIAVIHASGIIMTGSGGSSLLGGEVIGSSSLTKVIRQVKSDPTVKAVVLRVDSPGGSALASDLIWNELEGLKELKKPFVVSMGDVAASGGYYISMGADRIFAEPGTITGSIGVVSMKFALANFYEKLGINTTILTRGKNSGVMSSSTPWTESERAAMKRLSDDFYRIFTQKAATGRKMDYDTLEKLARGRVYTGAQAKELKLIDDLGTLDDAIAYAKKAAGFGPDDRLELQRLPKPVNPVEQLLGIPDPEARLEADTAPVPLSVEERILPALIRQLPPDVAAALRQAQLLPLIGHEGPLVLMPFRVNVK